VFYLYDATDTFAMAEVKVYRTAARHLGIVLVDQAVRTEAEAQGTLAQLRTERVDGILTPVPSASLNIPGSALEAASQQGIPIMFDSVFWVERGALASYGPDYYASGKQAARLVDKILKGTAPAEIPVEVNSNIAFAINLKTAKTLGLTISPEMLYQAHHIVR
jgi:putative ABC transport system substrate-binding protein